MVECKRHVTETSTRNSNISNTPPQLQNPHCSLYLLRWAISIDNAPIESHAQNVTHSEQLAFAESIPTRNSRLMILTFQNSLDEFPSMHFLLSNTIQSPKTNCIKNSLAVFWASVVQQLHTITFRRELNREQYSSKSHAQKQLLWDIADRTPRPVKHALKPVDIAIQYHIDKEIEGSRFLSDVSFQGNSFHSPIASNDANASSS